MEISGSKLLHTMAIIEILSGIFTLGIALTAHNFGSAAVQASVKTSQMATMMMYALPAVEIIVGFIGLMFSKKPESYMVCVICGLILIATVAASFFVVESTTQSMVSHVVSFVFPVLYVVGAFQNKQYI
ncbi:MAG: hypothetical protein RR252_05900 [Longicatena sp.]